MTNIINSGKILEGQTALSGVPKIKIYSPNQPVKVPISIKPLSSLLLALSISCLSGIAVARIFGVLVNLGHFEKFIAAGTAIILLASGLKIVPTFHKGVIVLLSHRLPRFVLAEGCHWLPPMIYHLKAVPITRSVLKIDDFEVLTQGDPGEFTEFTNLKLNASVEWQVIDPVRVLETQRDVLEKLLVLLVTESIRMAALRDGCNYSSIVRTVGKSLSDEAIPMASQKVASLGVMVHDIFFTRVKRADTPPGNTQVFVKSARASDEVPTPSSDPWAATGLI